MALLLTLVSHLVAAALLVQHPQSPRLNITEYIVHDTAKYESFRLKVINDSDSLVAIDRAVPSCGCVLVTIQHRLALKNQPADIYVAVTVNKMSDLQPITVDVYTNRNPNSPLRLYIRKAPKTMKEEGQQPAAKDSSNIRTEHSRHRTKNK